MKGDEYPNKPSRAQDGSSLGNAARAPPETSPTFQRYDTSVNKSIHDKVPACAVPKTDCDESQNQISIYISEP